MNIHKKILTLALSSIFISTSATAADKNWGGFKIGIGIGGQTSESRDKTSAEHTFNDESQYTTNSNPATADTVRTNQTNTFGSNSKFGTADDTNTDIEKITAIDTIIGKTDDSSATWYTGGIDGSGSETTNPGGGFDAGTNVFNRNYNVTESFLGSAISSDDLSSSNIFGTLEVGYDWMLSDKVVFGLNASLNLKSNAKAKGTGGGGNSAGWTESLSYNYITNSSALQGSGGGGSSLAVDTWYSTQNADLTQPEVAFNPLNPSQTSQVGTTTGVETGNSFDLGARLGYLVNDGTLIFLSGGASAIKAKQTMSYTSRATVNGTDSYLGDTGDSTNSYYYNMQDSNRDTRFGYYIGAGIETMLSEKVTAKLEYRYADYGKMTSSTNNSPTLADGGNNDLEFYNSIGGSSSTRHTSEITAQSIRATISYNF